MSMPLTTEHLAALRKFDTCVLANAIEAFQVRLNNEGFTNSTVRCLLAPQPVMLGYAVTGKIRCSSPPSPKHPYVDRTDWWNYIQRIPAPRVAVIEDIDVHLGLGSYVGEVHATILKRLGCVGLVTNGAVRDLHGVEKIGFPLFAGHTTVSHSYVHFVEIGGEVEIGGLKIQPGDLLHGDRHGILSIPPTVAVDLPAVAARILENERRILELCASPDFSLQRLREAVTRRVDIKPR